jgi:protein phosphatase
MKNFKIIILMTLILNVLAIPPVPAQTPDTTAGDSAKVAPDSIATPSPPVTRPDSVVNVSANSVPPQSSDTTGQDTGDLRVAVDSVKVDSIAGEITDLSGMTTADSTISTATGSIIDTLPDTTTQFPDSGTSSSRNEPVGIEAVSSTTSSREPAQEMVSADSSQRPDTTATDSVPSQAARSQPVDDGGGGGWVFGIIGFIFVAAAAAAFILYRRSRREESYAAEIVAEIPSPPPVQITAKPVTEIKLAAGQLMISTAQHPGSRDEQQDAFAFSDPQSALTHRGMLALLADGMSGHAWGREGSRTAVRVFREMYQEKSEEETITRALKRVLTAANGAVKAFARERRAENNVGTTLAAAVIENANLYWISVGDTRLYLLRSGQLQQLTFDHIYFNKLMEAVSEGKMKKAEAEKHPDHDALYSFIGLKRLPDISVNKEAHLLKIGDRLLLCSEGLYKTLSSREISEILSGNPKTIAETLVKHALEKENPEQENVTAIAIVIE